MKITHILVGLIALLWSSLSWCVQPIAEEVHWLRANLQQPAAVAVDEHGTVFVLDGLKRRVVVFDAQGKVLRELILPGTAGEFLATDITVQSNMIYVADPSANRILVINVEGVFQREIKPKPVQDEMPEPSALLIDGNRLWWSDRNSHKLCRAWLNKTTVAKCWGGRGSKSGQFQYPYMLAVDNSGYIMAVDVLNARVQVFASSGQLFGSIGVFGITNGSLYRPNGITISQDGAVLVSDAWMGTVTLFQQRKSTGVLRQPNGEAWYFDMPVGLASWKDRIYVVDMKKNAVQVLRLIELDNNAFEEIPAPVASKASGRSCLQCHISWFADFNPDATAVVLPVADERMCLSCHHGAVVESRQRMGRGHQHPSLHLLRENKPAGDVTRFEADKVPTEFPLGKDNRLYCGSCHTPHDKPKGAKAIGAGRKNPWLRQTTGNSELCLSCHASKKTAKDAPQQLNHKILNHPLNIIMQAPSHQDMQGYAKQEELQKGLPASLKAKGARLGERHQLICQSCHNVHGGESESLLVENTEVAELCVQCHQSQHSENEKEARQKGVHPINLKLKEAVKLAGKTINNLNCLACHAVHDAVPNTPLLVETHLDGALCKACHEKQIKLIDTDHDLRKQLQNPTSTVSKLLSKADVCGGCHALHGGNKKAPFLFSGPEYSPDPKLELTSRDQLCMACHNEDNDVDAKPVENFTHPWKDLILRSDPKDMPLLNQNGEIAEFGQIACITCHESHVWHSGKDEHGSATKDVPANEEGTVLNSFLRRNSVEGSFCVSCHGAETRRKYKYYHDSQGREKQLDYLH